MTGAPALQMPLSRAASGRTLRLQRITGGGGNEAHLASLGLVQGAELQVLNRTARGPFLIALKSGRLVLGLAFARHIWVS